MLGRISGESLRRAGVPVDADYYLCGPDAFMTTLSSSIAAQGTPLSRSQWSFLARGQSGCRLG
jgi:ferredoxin-NADP reductase